MEDNQNKSIIKNKKFRLWIILFSILTCLKLFIWVLIVHKFSFLPSWLGTVNLNFPVLGYILLMISLITKKINYNFIKFYLFLELLWVCFLFGIYFFDKANQFILF